MEGELYFKKADKVSCIVVWVRVDNFREAQKQLSDKSVYPEIQCKKQMLSNLVDNSNRFSGYLHDYYYFAIFLFI